jgi:hypothetical protein
MFSLFKRKAPPEEDTFKSRVEKFWRWYTEAAPRLYQTIEDKRCADLADEVSAKVDELGSFAWVFSAGPAGGGHAFTVTAEGDRNKQFLTEYWCQQAPQLKGWTFYPARQATELINWELTFGDTTFSPQQFWIAVSENTETERFDLSVWHPTLATLPEKQRWTILFVTLDEALGEFETQKWIGEIKFTDAQLKESMSLKEFRQFIEEAPARTGWKKRSPTDTATLYRYTEPREGRRSDIIAGTTMDMPLISEFGHSEDCLPDPLEGTGADFVFIQFDVAVLLQGRQVEVRGEIEDKIHDALVAQGSGRRIGGALGKRFAYIDLLIFDGTRSIEIIKNVTKPLLPKGSSLEFFAQQKRSHRVVIS